VTVASGAWFAVGQDAVAENRETLELAAVNGHGCLSWDKPAAGWTFRGDSGGAFYHGIGVST
jgi:hypothetical protein